LIGRLRGRVASEEVSGLVLVDVGGVGYEVTTPAGTLGRARRSGGDEVELVIHTHVREEAFELFGFASEQERRVFRLLIGVPNVGPKTAVGVLSALPAAELSRAVRMGDVARLTKVPGIGKKTAERLVLELKEKLTLDGPTESAPGTTPSQPAGGAAARLTSALTNMGYRASEAEKAVTSLGPRVDSSPLTELLREALAILSS
jgi:holliday junction DNA helicase RuvA